MNPTVKPGTVPAKRRRSRPILTSIAAGLGLAALGYASLIAYAFASYGHITRRADDLLDAVMPDYEVLEHHETIVNAPAAEVFEIARNLRFSDSPLVRVIFAVRTIPSQIRGESNRRVVPAGLVDWAMALGWGILADLPDRIVMGAVTQPWAPAVEFHAIPAQEFRTFAQPGFAKIVWTVVVEPLGPSRTRAWTETRVTTTDAESRRKFRRYWAVVSPGVVLIRYEALRLLKSQAEARPE